MDRRVEIFERLLQVSEEQAVYLDGNRLVDMLSAQQERDGLFSELKALPGVDYKADAHLNGLREKIIANDKDLALKMESMLADLGGKLRKINDNGKAAKAYRKK